MKLHKFIGPAILILLWTVVTSFHIVDVFFLPSPLTIIKKLVDLFVSGSIVSDIGLTLGRVAVSFSLSAVIGIPLGLYLGKTEKVYHSVEFLVDFFRSTPVTAQFPLFLLIFGVSDLSKIMATTFSCTLLVILSCAYGIMHAKKSRILAARIMGASEAYIFRHVLIWESLPQIFIALRTILSWALIIIIITEMFIGTNVGLGRRIIDAQMTYEISTMYAVILLTGIIGYVLNLLFTIIEKRFLHWSGK